ncbi:hypothetical protein [Micromonospora sp. NPDC005707]|uniref:hypothetical protein n=1 Tax=Micromonospora sp. NPDC005707 TaxID=3157050 RepID=UPI0033C52B9F
MDRLGEIAFRLPRTPASRTFLDQVRTLLADVPYAEPVRAHGAVGGPVERLVLARGAAAPSGSSRSGPI